MDYEVDFLPVGEGVQSGDAIALRFGNLYGDRSEQTVVVIDGGFKESGENLVEHIIKYYGTGRVELVISTHPDADHAAGLEVVLKQLEVDCFWMHRPWNHTDDIARMFKDGRVTDLSVREALRRSLDTVRGLERLAESKGIPIIEPFAGVQDASGQVLVVGPTESFYQDLLPNYRGTPEPKVPISLLEKLLRGAQEIVQKVAEWWDYETLDDSGETTAENNSSVILLVFVDQRCLLFTGDAGIPALTDTVGRLSAAGFDFSRISFIDVPHHGSKRNIGPSVLNQIVGPKRSEDKKLKTAFVSASKEVFRNTHQKR